MRKYIVDLTNQLIGKHRFDDDMGRFISGWSIAIANESDLMNHIATTVGIHEVADMRPETLGRIMAHFEIGEVMTTKKEIFEHVHFSGNCEDFLRELVAFCLACVIRDRLSPNADEMRVIPYRRKAAIAR